MLGESSWEPGSKLKKWPRSVLRHRSCTTGITSVIKDALGSIMTVMGRSSKGPSRADAGVAGSQASKEIAHTTSMLAEIIGAVIRLVSRWRVCLDGMNIWGIKKASYLKIKRPVRPSGNINALSPAGFLPISIAMGCEARVGAHHAIHPQSHSRNSPLSAALAPSIRPSRFEFDA